LRLLHLGRANNPFDLTTLHLPDAPLPPACMGSKPGYFLGTDDQGRDVLSAIMLGADTFSSARRQWRSPLCSASRLIAGWLRRRPPDAPSCALPMCSSLFRQS
jgi:hypothetical protein